MKLAVSFVLLSLVAIAAGSKRTCFNSFSSCAHVPGMSKYCEQPKPTIKGLVLRQGIPMFKSRVCITKNAKYSVAIVKSGWDTVKGRSFTIVTNRKTKVTVRYEKIKGKKKPIRCHTGKKLHNPASLIQVHDPQNVVSHMEEDDLSSTPIFVNKSMVLDTSSLMSPTQGTLFPS